MFSAIRYILNLLLQEFRIEGVFKQVRDMTAVLIRCCISAHIVITIYSMYQVEATTEKRAEVRGQDGPFSQDTKRPRKMARPALTGLWI